MHRVRGFIDLVFDMVDGTTRLVEKTHDEVVARSVRRFAPIEPAKSTALVVTGVQTRISRAVFQSIRLVNGITRLSVNAAAATVELALEATSDPASQELATPMRSSAAGSLTWCVDFLQASLNGFFGDYLNERNSRLDLGMSLRHEGRYLPATRQALAGAFPEPTSKVCIFVHSLAGTEWLWSQSAERHYGDPDVTFGSRLRDDLGFTPIYLRYNTGRHISENGRALAKLITETLAAYPVPVEEIALIGHSMGGLVARSAAHYARQQGEPWIGQLRHVACVGSPHLGAPLEKAAHLLTAALHKIDAAGTRVPAELLRRRSAGVKDLRYGYTVDEEWAGRDPDAVFADARRNVPLVDGVGYYFLAATLTRDPGHPLGRVLGDLLVRLPSATGVAPEPARRIHFSDGAVVPGLDHIQIANHPEIYEVLRELFAA